MIERAGSRAAMHSIWRLPQVVIHAQVGRDKGVPMRQRETSDLATFRGGAECFEARPGEAPAVCAEPTVATESWQVVPLAPAVDASDVVSPATAPISSCDPLQRSREIRTMGQDELRAYAKQVGVRQRDIDELTQDRLRQNCMLTVAALVEAYTG